jgi:adenosylmethionine-8-amino-7-oxononanoate aminotransferase
MAQRLEALAQQPAFANPRQLGVIAAIDLIAPDAGYLSDLAPRLRAFALENGLLLRPLGNTIYLMPPYCLDADQLDRVFAVLRKAGEKFGVSA